MDADFSIELGREDPVLDFPWQDPAGKLAYVDLKRSPELLARIEEAVKFPELGEFLRMLNSSCSLVETAKCDAWSTSDLTPEEEIYNASHKFAGYVDVVFSEADVSQASLRESPSRQSSLRQSLSRQSLSRQSLPVCEHFVRKLVELLRRAPEIRSAAEVCVRRCYYGEDAREGSYFTLYVSGYGNDEASARQNWGVGLKLVGNAVLQLSAGELRRVGLS
ncbi:MAG: hypothetical protein WA718_10915 [Terriglobales bacterium]